MTAYRDRRTHRVAPTVDHTALGVVLQAMPKDHFIPLFAQNDTAEFDFFKLYADAKNVYDQLLVLLAKLNEVIHA